MAPVLKRIRPRRVAAGVAAAQASPRLHGRVGLTFGAMSASGYIGDKHPGQWPPFWEQACAAEAPEACLNLYFLHDDLCTDGSAWACNEIGIMLVESYDNRAVAAGAFERACTLRFARRLRQRASVAGGGSSAPCRADGGGLPVDPRGSKGPVPEDLTPDELRARVCDAGWQQRLRVLAPLHGRSSPLQRVERGALRLATARHARRRTA